MKIKKGNVLGLNAMFTQLLSQQTEMGFHYLIYKNVQLIKTEIDALQEVNKPTKEYEAFEAKRIETCEAHSNKDEDGNIIKIVDENTGIEQYDIPDREAFNKVIDVVREEFAEALAGETKRREDFLSLLEEEIEIEFHKIKPDQIPKNVETNGFDAALFFECCIEL